MQKQIDEVMGLVNQLKEDWSEWLSVEDEQLCSAERKVEESTKAIETKLRELLPVWKPIESARMEEGSEIWAYVDGEQAAMRYTETPDGDLWCWCDEALSDIDPEPNQPHYWMPLPKAPE